MTFTAPMIVRVGGLPSSLLEMFSSRLPQAVEQMDACQAARDEALQRLVDRIFEALPNADPDARSFLLTVKRDAFNRRPMGRHLRHRLWPKVESIAPGESREVRDLEAEAEQRTEDFRAAYTAVLCEHSAALLAAIEDPELLRAIALSSPLAVEHVGRLYRKPRDRYGRKERKGEISFLRYLSRAAYKTSPFSTLTRLGLLDVEPGADGLRLEGAPWKQHTTLRAKRYIAEQLRDLLAVSPAVIETLPLRLAPTLEWIDDGRKVRFLRPERQEIDVESESLRYYNASIVSLPLDSDLVDWLRGRLQRDPATLPDLRREIVQEFGEDRWPDTAQIPDRLLRYGLLAVRWPWSSQVARLEEALHDLLASLPAEAGFGELVSTLAQIVELEKAYRRAERPAAVVREIDALFDRAWEQACQRVSPEMPVKRNKRERIDFYEDAILEGSDGPTVARLSPQSIDRIVASGSPAVRLATLFDTRHDFLLALHAFCRHVWPDRTEVGVIELFGAAQPLWKEYSRFTAQRRRSREAWNETFEPETAQAAAALEALAELRALRLEVWSRVDQAIQSDGESSTLDPARLDEILDRVPQRFQSDLGGSFVVQPADSEGRQWVLNRLFEGTGRYSSRYTSVMPPEMRDAYVEHMVARSRVEVRSTPSEVGETAELFDIFCPQGDTLNLRAPSTPRILQLSGEVHELDRERQLHPGRLRVDLAGEAPVLRTSEGTRLMPAHLGGVNLWFMPPLAKFLVTFGAGDLGPIPWPRRKHRGKEEVDVLERLELGCLVLARRRWIFDPRPLLEELDGLDDASAHVAVDRWRRLRGLPSKTFLIEPVGDGYGNGIHKPQYLDFESPLFVQLFRSTLQHDLEQMELEEVLPGPRDLPVDSEGRSWVVEIQLETLALESDRRLLRRSSSASEDPVSHRAELALRERAPQPSISGEMSS